MTPVGSLPKFVADFTVAGRRIGGDARCFVIAEAGVNHFGDVSKAIALVDMAVAAGADALKFQHFRTDKLIGPSAPAWRERMRSKELTDQAIGELQQACVARGIQFLCTAHDEESLDFLDRELAVPAFKIGSGEVENWPFLANVAGRGKPIILSTGMYSLDQVTRAIDVIAEAGGRELAILHCVTSYPCPPEWVNLDAMRQIRDLFEGPVGYSDHTSDVAVPLAAVALGAAIIEKHITIDVDVPNAQDWKVSCTPATLGPFIKGIRDIEAAKGGWRKAPAAGERDAIVWARKSITTRRRLEAGETIEPQDVIFQRPGTGLPPSRIETVVGRRLRVAADSGMPITAEMLEGST